MFIFYIQTGKEFCKSFDQSYYPHSVDWFREEEEK